MFNFGEVALTVSSSADDHLTLRDLRSGAVLTTYKTGQTGGIGPHGVSITSCGQFALPLLLAASADRPVVNSWYWQKDQVHVKSTLAEKVPVIATSPDGLYIVGGSAQGRLFVWEIATGSLLKMTEAHYKPITVIRFTDDGSHVVVGAEDALVTVWRFSTIATTPRAQRLAPQATPVHSLADHSLPISDIHMGVDGFNCRFATASMDRTCKLWELASGILLCSFVFPTSISSVLVDPAELLLIAGGADGHIYPINIHEQSMSTVAQQHQQQRHGASFAGSASAALDTFVESGRRFEGHSRAVSSLALSFDGTTLLSGGQDGAAIVWDVRSGQIVKTFAQHKGPVTNVFIFFRPPELMSLNAKRVLPIAAPLKRFLATEEGVTENDIVSGQPMRIADAAVDPSCAPCGLLPPAISSFPEQDAAATYHSLGLFEISASSTDPVAELDHLREQVAHLRQLNDKWQQVANKYQRFIADDLTQQ
ncbi:hypothetical protein CAOG_07371 [Capsaspora owczarzaki ATCC 30864]|uniref:Uncharacterized protein n=1 Tax=Capsaspora owczarzaki (strain ATCC 30864) TaxID=595528 RepID=A0A0D2WWV4_CAPO3|nr:hypothetical protein CAOG_07371 [Capsaspora owczarzaki ATCC 30864]KJE97530.1 hypothetical protein CAOG_007371 [Capsaspora owczarzaki ATCC 30864]|eukprot:XP_004343230.1 hypothetical protein CAOG_07371 [Capsaspora owczarzaki ATCC 30864]